MRITEALKWHQETGTAPDGVGFDVANVCGFGTLAL
jgi:hypothetical protein